MLNRQLVRPGEGASAPRATVNVVGLISNAAFTALGSDESSPPDTARLRGSIPPKAEATPSHLAFDDGRIESWSHRIQTLSEDLTYPPNEAAVDHPGYAEDGGAEGASAGPPLVAFGNAVAGEPGVVGGAGGGMYGAHPRGLLCLWSSSSLNRRDVGGGEPPAAECDAHARLLLDPDETVSCIASLSTGGGSLRDRVSGASTDAHDLLVLGTSHGDVWLATKTARPLELHARPLVHRTRRERKAEATTPGKWLVSRLVGGYGEDEVEFDEVGHGEEGMFAVLPLPTGYRRTTEGREVRKSPMSTPEKRATKTQRLDDGKNGVSFLTAGEDLTVRKWTLRHTTGSSPSGGGAGPAGGALAYEESIDESLSLLAHLPTGSGEGESRILGCALSTDASVVTVVASVEGEHGETSLHLLHVNLTSWGGLRVEANPVWLSRYASETISSGLSCVGLITTPVEPSGYVTYAAFQHPEAPAVLTAVHCPTHADAICHDMDLPTRMVPSLIPGAISHDEMSDGVSFMCGNGIIVSGRVVFPSASGDGLPRSQSGTTKEEVDPAQIQTLTNHLLSIFAQYSVVQDRRRREEKSARTAGMSRDAVAVPPSLQSSGPAALGQAVVSAAVTLSKEPAFESSSGLGADASMARQPHEMIDSVVRMKRDHEDFVNFLVHAGIYRRVSTVHRVKLRDVGERINAVEGILNYWQAELNRSRRGGRMGGAKHPQEDGRSEARTAISAELSGLEGKCAYLSEALGEIQSRLLFADAAAVDTNEPHNESDRAWILRRFSAMLCVAYNSALRQRETTSEKLYDLPIDSGCPPWVSSVSSRSLLNNQLKLIRDWNFVPSEDSDKEHETARVRVETLSTVLLDAHRDVRAEERDEAEYDAAKALAIPLVRSYGAGDDAVALKLSLENGWYEGIVQICHDNAPVDVEVDGDESPSSPYDLGRLLSPEASTYKSLHKSKDFETGLSFPYFALKWHADRGLFSSVLNLGRNCPNVLSDYLRDDSRMTEYRWINSVRVGNWNDAADNLVGNIKTSRSSTGKTYGNGQQSLEETVLTVSLAKLAHKIVERKQKEQTAGGILAAGADKLRMGQRGRFIRDRLELAQAQEMLTENDGTLEVPVGKAAMMSGLELLNLSMDRLDMARDLDERVRLCLIGLAVVRASEETDESHDQESERARRAAHVWSRAVTSDWNTWRDLTERTGDVSNEEMDEVLTGTVFYGLMREYHESNVDEAASLGVELEGGTDNYDELGFLANARVQDMTLAEVGADGNGDFGAKIGSLLQMAATMASAY